MSVQHRAVGAVFSATVAFFALASWAQEPGPVRNGADSAQQRSARPPGTAPIKRAKPRRKSASGLYPVYAFPDGWVLLDREGRSNSLAAGTEVLVIGSKGAGVFAVARSTRTWASCVEKRPGRVSGYFLAGKAMGALGTPIAAIRAPKGKGFDTRRARFYRLANEVSNETYRAHDAGLRRAIVADVESGAFLFAADDSLGAHFAQRPDPDKIQLRLDFGSKLRVQGREDAFVMVEGANIARSFRRCLRLWDGHTPIGACAEMPHKLMAETQLLDFVAYDLSGSGQPFMLAYSTSEPLWGHERWVFALTEAGAQRFLGDTLDFKCRERF